MIEILLRLSLALLLSLGLALLMAWGWHNSERLPQPHSPLLPASALSVPSR
ncbi:hypothetical protein [Hydrogenophaga sp.]|uniref:hypothetical protein n=1 Tax=Hydrogenophaga sp. TaxID=1904254 RepID=UPI0025BCB747|nr:hypothetical protein [Hydrogenophaga sp.]